MITDTETNILYLADRLTEMYPSFAADFLTLLDANSISYKFLPKTKDIWAVDYMPVQLGMNSFVRFVYDPDYLRTKAGQKTISDVPQILKDIRKAERHPYRRWQYHQKQGSGYPL